jgi:hypothetical protein
MNIQLFYVINVISRIYASSKTLSNLQILPHFKRKYLTWKISLSNDLNVLIRSWFLVFKFSFWHWNFLAFEKNLISSQWYDIISFFNVAFHFILNQYLNMSGNSSKEESSHSYCSNFSDELPILILFVLNAHIFS